MAIDDYKLLEHDINLIYEMTQIGNDFSDDAEAGFLIKERWYAGDRAFYNSGKKKMIYKDFNDADEAYLNFQREGMLRHKWIESEKAGRDVGEMWAAKDWIEKYADAFKKFWRRTHVFIPVKKPEIAFELCCKSDYY